MSSSIKSAIWMLFASLNFALLNTLVKFLSKDFHLTQIIFFRSFFAVVFILPWILNNGFKSLKTNSYRLQLSRSLLALIAMYLWFYSISNIPLAKATAINFTAPVFGAIFAIFMVRIFVIRIWIWKLFFIQSSATIMLDVRTKESGCDFQMA